MQTEIWRDIWSSLELAADSGQDYARLVVRNMLFRAYLAFNHVSRLRYAIIEVPELQKQQLESLPVSKGLNIYIRKTGQEQIDCISCVIEASTEKDNDVFFIVVKDIVLSLSKVTAQDKYAISLKDRLITWQEFFKKKGTLALSIEKVIGLYGELLFINKALKAGCVSIIKMWNGPNAEAQDFQTSRCAIEVKARKAYISNTVWITNISQLDIEDREKLFLVVYKLEEINVDGMSLPELVEETRQLITDLDDLNLFNANLETVGYYDIHKDKYTQKFIVRNEVAFEIKDDFPKIIRDNVSNGILDCKYEILLDMCANYQVDINDIFELMER